MTNIVSPVIDLVRNEIYKNIFGVPTLRSAASAEKRRWRLYSLLHADPAEATRWKNILEEKRAESDEQLTQWLDTLPQLRSRIQWPLSHLPTALLGAPYQLAHSLRLSWDRFEARHTEWTYHLYWGTNLAMRLLVIVLMGSLLSSSIQRLQDTLPLFLCDRIGRWLNPYKIQVYLTQLTLAVTLLRALHEQFSLAGEKPFSFGSPLNLLSKKLFLVVNELPTLLTDISLLLLFLKGSWLTHFALFVRIFHYAKMGYSALSSHEKGAEKKKMGPHSYVCWFRYRDLRARFAGSQSVQEEQALLEEISSLAKRQDLTESTRVQDRIRKLQDRIAIRLLSREELPRKILKRACKSLSPLTQQTLLLLAPERYAALLTFPKEIGHNLRQLEKNESLPATVMKELRQNPLVNHLYRKAKAEEEPFWKRGWEGVQGILNGAGMLAPSMNKLKLPWGSCRVMSSSFPSHSSKLSVQEYCAARKALLKVKEQGA